MKLLLLHDKQLYADFILLSLIKLESKCQVTHITCGDALRSIEDIYDYDLAIVDTGLRDKMALEAIRLLNGTESPVPVLVIADMSNPALIIDTFKYQVMAYVSMDDKLPTLEETVVRCIANDRQYARKTRKRIKNVVSQLGQQVSTVEVSKRERQILRMICQEKTSAEIADELELSEHTVLTHRKNILKKVSAKNTAGLVKYAIAHNLITI